MNEGEESGLGNTEAKAERLMKQFVDDYNSSVEHMSRVILDSLQDKGPYITRVLGNWTEYPHSLVTLKDIDRAMCGAKRSKYPHLTPKTIHSASPLNLSTSPHKSSNTLDTPPGFPLHIINNPFLSTPSKDN